MENQATAVVENPYGLTALWSQGDIVARSTLIILAMLFLAEFIGGLGVMILDINGGSLLIARTPDRLRGRAGGAFSFINVGIRPIGAVLGGTLGTILGVHTTLLIVTVAQLSGLLWLVGSPIPRLKELPEAGG